ncbi:M28 family peptidase [Leptolyngbya sp. FACHB-17]|uniref:M28 family peptidase n=1 Tax=unclassified Leptolyngbya TaxID=2650499 RepID=UPI0016805AC6|nr:M28 family peptidase [Leptolyngbya sp. FACHB-17]MBD2080134.1 M28 family peptidase [Leptolyngbya sp. FACHB-17]
MTRMKKTVKSIYAAFAVILATLPACTIQANRSADTVAASTTEAASPSESRVQETVQKLTQIGARVAGTPAAQQASQFLIEEYRKSGYQTEVQTFTYPKFRDLGSSVAVNGQTTSAQALNNSIAGQANARLVVVPNVGRPNDFASIDVKGAIAVVQRGEIPFSQKVDNAAKAGAIAVIVINSEDKPLRGTLSSPAAIPAIGITQGNGAKLLNAPSAQVSVNTERRTITGRNVIARLPGVTQPRLLLGGHYDSVSGSPGANDNASGTAVVLETARRLANTPLAREVWFVAFDGEEDGLQGSRAFVNSVQPQFLSGLAAMFNFDMVGINDRLLIGGSAELRSQLKQLNSNVPTFVPALTNSSSDHASFAAKGVPVLFFYRGSDPNYHSPTDRITNATSLNDTLQTALASINQVLQSK